ncbi:MAG TPA: hypothetical protein VM600_04720, partial [Actinomycetota bacterium]|nr:hypothetical protein [Actinomycetota bacterium]
AGRDELVLEAAPPARRWGGVIGIDAPVGRARALIANPGAEVVTATVRTFAKSIDERIIKIHPGRLVAIQLATTPGLYAIEVSADAPVAVVLDALARSRNQAVFAYGLSATPLLGASEVSVQRQPRAGVPAALSR